MKIQTKNFLLPALLVMLVMLATAHAASSQLPQPQTNSAQSSVKSGTRASNVLAACAAAVEELRASRALIDALEAANETLKARLETEKQTTNLLYELNETRKAETSALRDTVAAKNEAIAAKDAAISKQDELIAQLKARKSSVWKRVGDLMIGAAAGLILR